MQPSIQENVTKSQCLAEELVIVSLLTQHVEETSKHCNTFKNYKDRKGIERKTSETTRLIKVCKKLEKNNIH